MPTNVDDRPPDRAGYLLEGAIVQRADVGERAAVLKVRRPGETAYVLAAAGAGLGMSATKVPQPDGARRVVRLEGFRVARLAGGALLLSRDHAEKGREWMVLAAEASRITIRAAEAGWDEHEGARDTERDGWLERGASMTVAVTEGALEARRALATRALTKGIARLDRRMAAVRGDMARIGDAEALASRAKWLIGEAARAPRGASSLSVTDWSTGEALVVVVPLDPSKPAKEQVQAMFQRARRLKLGARIAEERLRATEAARTKLAAIAERLTMATDAAAVEASMAAARAVAPKDVTLASPSGAPARSGEGRGGRATQPRSPPFRTFLGAGGARILVGRGAAHNDALTFQTARPHDLWLHAKGRAGAHVVVPLAKNHSCPSELLVEAAHLAAHFSEARDEAVVEVQHVARRHLRKPRGSAPGLVVVDREKVMAVRIEPALLRALLEREEVSAPSR